MSAEVPARRTKTARELAEKWGISERSVYRRVAEPRAEFLARAKARRDRAVDLRAQGLSYAEIAAEMECSSGTVGRLLHDAKKLAERAAADGQAQAS